MAALAFRRFPPTASLLSLGLGLSRIVGAGLVAIGISGVLAFAAGSAVGKDFVSGDPPGVTYTAERCAELLEYYPGGSCGAAATAHHFDEVVTYRLVAGFLGLLVLAGERFLVPGTLRRLAPPLPPGITDVAGATAFGLATGVLLGLGISHLLVVRPELALSLSGSGQWLSGAVVAAPISAFALRLLILLGGVSASEAGKPRLR